ncbi:GNAT family N-acetyltransferase, partial [Photobacterium sanctipauli]
MEQTIKVRAANLTELDWVDGQYDKVGFKRSTGTNELIAIVEVNNVPVGLGRLQHIEPSVAEMGGIYVDENYRGLGLAAKVVEYLITHSTQYTVLYCLPFSPLAHFYNGFGFKSAENLQDIPKPIY